MQYRYIQHPPIEFDYGLLDKVTTPNTENLSNESAAVIENEWPNTVWTFNFDIVSGTYKSTQPYYPKDRIKKSLSRIGYDFLLDFFDEGEYINNCYLFFQGNGTKLRDKEKIFKHIHPPVDGEVTNTFTIIAPIDIVEPITETLYLNQQEVKTQFDSHDDWLDFCGKLKPIGEIKEIKYPKKGEILLVNFDSSSYTHWVEGIKNNKYLVLVIDGYTNDTARNL